MKLLNYASRATIIAILLSSCSSINYNNPIPQTSYLPKVENSDLYGKLYNHARSYKYKNVRNTIKNLDDDYLINSMLKALIATKDHQNYKAYKILKTIKWQLLPENWQMHYFINLSMSAKITNHLSDALSALSFSYNHFPQLHNQQHLLQIWDVLYKSSLHNIIKAQTSTNQQPEVKAWLQLMRIIKSPLSYSDDALLVWRDQNPNHPGNHFIKKYNKLTNQNIALLVPTTGPLKQVGHAIEKGFLESYYLSQNKGKIKIIDTNNYAMDTIYQQVKNANIDLVIGPVEKEKVSAWSQVQNNINTIALNSVPEFSNNLYELNLSMQDESYQIANHANENGIKKIAIIGSDDSKNQLIKSAFIKQWHNLGNHIVFNYSINDKDTLTQQLKSIFNIDQSELRAQRIRHLINHKIKFIPRARQDIDAIFLACNQDLAKKIMPLIRYYYLNKLPTFATSNVYQQYDKNTFDYKGIILPTSNWNSRKQTQFNRDIETKLATIWPHKNSIYNKFKAIGIDAYLISQTINQLQNLPYAYIIGATGSFYFINHNIRRINPIIMY